MSFIKYIYVINCQVFQYFASFQSNAGEVLMTPADLMRAVVPVFPPSESNRVREGFLRGERVPGELHCAPSKFFMLFDTNNDGLISFPEYPQIVSLIILIYNLFSLLSNVIDFYMPGTSFLLHFSAFLNQAFL